LEKSEDIAGLWRFQENGYGVMSFTHINVSKYNYCFSDYPIQQQTDERMHHTHIYEYVKSYCQMHKLFDFMCFKNEVVMIEGFI
jgi:dimethylaniline monooxygenase (N-oxide forming)